jgi:transcriptional regulator with GAF, ATPase, and Fis domain
VTSEYSAETKPILDAIADRVARLCESRGAWIFLVDGNSLRHVAGFGEMLFPINPIQPLTRASVMGRAVIDRTVVHVEDMAAVPNREYSESHQYHVRCGDRTMLAAPMLRADSAVGVILLRRSEVRPFDPTHIDLVKEFADQAADAIETLRLSAELKARDAELAEALDQQTATAEILCIISRSPADIQPVMEAVAASAARLCDAADVIIRRVDGETMRLVAHVGTMPVTPSPGLEVARKTFMGRAIRERRTIHIHDILEPRVRDEYPDALFLQRKVPGYRTGLTAPLLREDTAIGVIIVRRAEVRPFSERQIKLLETFAAQAVIAIENVRLFNEIQEKGRQLEIANQQLRQARRSLEEQNARLREEIEAHNRSRGTIECLAEEIRSSHDFGEILGESPGLLRLLDEVGQVSGTDSTVLIQGETGTGKELIARAIHGRSQRRERPLIKINCAALPRELVESELFGHEKGAFTGATQQRQGRFELADGGTLFLDEVSELPPETQAKLLRVLQEQEFERVGGTRPLRTDVRLIAATNRDLQQHVSAGAFRSDLYYRLNVFPLVLPPLRDRREDIPGLIRHFMDKAARKLGKPLTDVSPDFLEQAMAYDWPGNVRELANFVERSAILSKSTVLESAGPLAIKAGPAAAGSAMAQPSTPTLEDVERSYILRVLEQTRWAIEGKLGAARILGLNPSTLRGRLRKLGLRKNP